MRVTFTHPAIVRGSNPDGSPKAELCRVESEFEVPEYTLDDAPVALIASGQSRPSDYYHLHDGKLYMSFPDGENFGHFAAGRQLSYGLHNGNAHHVHFEPFYETVHRAAARMEDESGLAITVDARRELLKRESKIGMREVTKACLNAPMLRKWNWLSPDADQDVDHWRSIAAEKIGNVVLINGVPCLRAFEPCYALTTAYGTPQIQVASKRVFAKQVHVADKKADGLEVLGEDATFYKSHYFAASDFEGAVAFADTIGWRLLPNQRANIRIRDESAITDDFDILETVRHARLLLEAMDSRHFQYEVQNNAGKTTEFATKLAQLVADAKVLKDEVLSWQTNRDDVTALRRELTKLAEHALDCSDCGRRRPGSSSPILLAVHHRRGPAWEITGQLKEFIARADQAEVNLDIPMTRSLGR